MLCLKVNVKHCFNVGCIGRRGNLSLLWTDNFSITILSYSCYYIDAKINDHLDNNWRAIDFYGESVTHLRHRSWEALKSLKNHANLPWFLLSDFNEVLHGNEHQGLII